MSGLALQKALVSTLRADAGLSALVAQRIYDLPPVAPTFPYVTLGEDQTVPDRADCYEGSEITVTLHAWSREPGFPQVKRIVEAIRAALAGASFSLDGARLVDLAMTDARTTRDPDGLTSHGIISFRALIEPV